MTPTDGSIPFQQFQISLDSSPNNVYLIRRIPDPGYTSNYICEYVRDWNAIPYHGIKKNVVCKKYPKTAYEKMVYHAKLFLKQFQ